MKKYMIVFAAIAAVMSCTKESPIQENPVKEENQGTVVTLTANLPELTKATVDDTAFAWSEGDRIAIPTVGGGQAIFTNSAGNLNKFTCTLESGVQLAEGKAVYPAVTPGTSFESVDVAKKSFQMEADYTPGASTLNFTHKSALVKVTFTNVPSFATGLKVTDGETTVAEISGNASEYFVPITPNGNKTYTFSLMEGEHVLKSAAKTTTLVAGTYYATPSIIVPNILAFAASSSTIVQYYKDDDYSGLETLGDSNKYHKVNVDNKEYYYTIPTKAWTQGDWFNIECAVDGDWSKKGKTWVYGVRHLFFTLSGSGSMASSYRVYWDNSKKNWENVYIHIWNGTTGKNTTFPGNKLENNYYEFEEGDYGQAYKYLFNDGTGHQTGDIDPGTIHEDRIFSE